VRALAARRKIQHVVVSTPDEGTTATSAAEASRMASLLDASLDPLWHLLYVPIRWISDGAVEPELERPLEYLELVFLALVVALTVDTLWDAARKRAREHERRAGQAQWRQLQGRKRRLTFAPKGHEGERLGPPR